MDEHVNAIIALLKSSDNLIGDIAVYIMSEAVATFMIHFRRPEDPYYENEEMPGDNYTRMIMHNIYKNDMTDYDKHVTAIKTKLPCP